MTRVNASLCVQQKAPVLSEGVDELPQVERAAQCLFVVINDEERKEDCKSLLSKSHFWGATTPCCVAKNDSYPCHCRPEYDLISLETNIGGPFFELLEIVVALFTANAKNIGVAMY
uniref:Uncharacterized mitochondrial protein AtMg00810-like n=1 Tax=Tanacetum cinerariifolium TaxID=118510 RepID=A0A6L2JV59_TANCI|nr:uncharacterized mitochondrial protein AtMg00810-like [Tanacetum cinerariifolium]